MYNSEEFRTKKWYEDGIAIHIIVVLFFPVGLFLLWRSRYIAKWWKVTLSCITTFFILVSMFGDNLDLETRDTEKQEAMQKRIKEIEKEEKQEAIEELEAKKTKKQELKETLERSIKEYAGGNLGAFQDKSKDTRQTLQFEAAFFSSWKMQIDEAKSYDDKELKDLAIKFEKVAKRVQKKEFPKMRKAYQKFLSKELWEFNIKIKVTGSKYTSLHFTGAYFYDNAMKKQYQTDLRQMFQYLRFKKIFYMGSDYDEDGIYYTMETPKDTDLVIIE